MKTGYTPAQVEWLRSHCRALSLRELTEQYNAAFGQSRTAAAIKSTLGREGIVTGRPKGNPVGTLRMWTSAQVEFIRAAYQVESLRQVTVRLNHEFATSFTVNQVRSLVSNNGIRSGRSGCFYPGQARVPGSGAKGPNRTSFKPGRPAHEARNYLPIGSTRISKDGYIERKVTDDPGLYPARRWVAEHRLVWEAANGPIPEDSAIVFLDGDRTNISPNNLRCVHRSVLAHLNQRYNELGDTQGEARKAGILVAEVISKAHRRAKV